MFYPKHSKAHDKYYDHKCYKKDDKKDDKHCKNKKSDQPICDLLSTLNPGTPLNNITVDGATVIAFNFASFDCKTQLATFLDNNGDFVVADCNKIGSVEFFNI